MRKGGLQAWCVWFIGSLFYLYEYFIRVIPSVLSGVFDVQLGASNLQISLAVGSYFMIYAPMQLFVGPLFDILGGRKLLLKNSILLALSCLLPIIPFYTLFFLGMGRFAMGFSSAFGFVGVIYLCAIWFPKNQLALLSGLTSSLGVVGAVVAQISLSWIDTNYNTIWLTSCVLGFGVFCLLYYFIPNDAKKRHPSEKKVWRQCKERLLYVGKQPTTWVIGLLTGSLFMPFAVFADFWSIPYFTKVCSFTSMEASQLVAILNLSWAIGAPIIGWFSDRWHIRKTSMFLGGISAAVSLSFLIFCSHFSFQVMAFVISVLGLCCGTQVIGFSACITQNPYEMSATSISFVNMILMGLCGIVQSFIGCVIDWANKTYSLITAYQIGLSMMIVILIITSVLFYIFFKERKVECVK